MEKDDVVTIWGLYKEKYGDVRPDDIFERVIYYNLKIMFEPHDSDIECMKLKNNRVEQWYLFQSCGVHMLVAEGVIIYMLVEKDYPALNFSRDFVNQMI